MRMNPASTTRRGLVSGDDVAERRIECRPAVVLPLRHGMHGETTLCRPCERRCILAIAQHGTDPCGQFAGRDARLDRAQIAAAPRYQHHERQ